jgi:hypothetical protein
VFDNPTPVPESTAKFLRLVSELAVGHPAVVAQVVLDVHLTQELPTLSKIFRPVRQKKFGLFSQSFAFLQAYCQRSKEIRASITKKISNNVRKQSNVGHRFFFFHHF